MSRHGFRNAPKEDALLRSVFQAYRYGLRRQLQPRSTFARRDFGTLMFLGTIGWVPLKERLQLRHLHIACGEGLVAARQDRLDDAFTCFERAKSDLDLLEHKTEPAWLLGVSTYQSGVAYLDFRRGCVERARERLDHAMDADLELEQIGLPVIQMHRIQQGHNLARMDLRLGQCESAFALAGNLLAYMERKSDELPYHREWRARSLRAVPRRLLRTMIHQIIGETAGFIVTGDMPYKGWSILIETSRLWRNPEIAVFPQVQYALRAQRDRLMGDLQGSLCNLERFFLLGILNCHLLWYAMLVDLAGLCHELDTGCSRQVGAVIARDAAKWKGVPPLLRDHLGLAPQSAVA